ncbi:MAG: type IV pilin protein, partial [Pseudomonadales bacterium]
MKRERGFTLGELMIVVVIVGILATIAYPTYQDQIRKSRRIDAKNALMNVANRQEQFILDRSTYTLNMADLGFGADPMVSTEGYYTVDAAVGACGAITRCFTLTATPVAGKSQAGDSKCTAFSLASTGAR